MASVLDLCTCARKHIANYVDPEGPRAFAVYDRQGGSTRLEPVDALAPAFLDAPVRGSLVTKMFGDPSGPYGRLRVAMQELLDETAVVEPSFASLDLGDATGPWRHMRRVLQLSDDTPGLAASMVTKMLHRKRPNLVPIFDSKVAAFYGATSRAPWTLWPVLQDDLRSAESDLRVWSSGVQTSDQRPVSLLRVLDIVVWEHVETGCTGDAA